MGWLSRALEKLLAPRKAPEPPGGINIPKTTSKPVVRRLGSNSAMFDERTEKNIATLHTKLQEKAREFMALAVPAMAVHGLAVRIISGTRTYAEQTALYAKGRTTKGPKVTNARAGYSNHNFGFSFDVGLFKDKAYLGSSPKYAELGPIGESVGLEWGGRWKSFKDEPHFEYPHGLSMSQLRARYEAGKPLI